MDLNFIVGAELGADIASRKSGGAERSGKWEVAERNGAGSRGYRNRLERGAAFSPLTLRSHALPKTDPLCSAVSHSLCDG